jgi:serine/threonine protein phosphatase PrpC
MALRLRAGSATDVGNVRANNQDDLLILPGSLFVVADGMGGHASGEVASREVVETLRTTYDGEASVDAFRTAIRYANRAVWRRGVDEPAHAGMGTTLTAVAVVEEDSLAVANVGDSRTYLLRDGTLSQLTSDHSFVQEAVRTGQLSQEEAESHPRRSQLTRAVGIGDDVDVDIDVLVPRSGDRLLLCSDGLWDELPDDAIGSILRRVDDPDAASAELVRQAKEAGGRDNVTVVVVDVLDADEEERGLAASAALTDEPTVAAPAVTFDDDSADDDEEPVASGGALLRTPPAPPAEDAVAEPAPRLVTWRVVLFGIVLVAVLVGAFLAFRGGASAWKVGFSGNNVAIFKGDNVREQEPLTREMLSDEDRIRLDKGVALESLAEAKQYVDGLAVRAAARTLPTVTSTTVPVAETTVPPTTVATATTAPIGP